MTLTRRQWALIAVVTVLWGLNRSEERRVGKECW